MGDGLHDSVERKKGGDDEDEDLSKRIKGIMTSPGKKGTFGYPKLLMGNKDAPVLGGEYAIDRAREVERGRRKQHVEAIGERRAFRSQPGSGGAYFAGGAGGILGRDDKCTLNEDTLMSMTPKQLAEKKFEERGFEKDFVQMYQPKSGITACLGKFPEHMPDTYTNVKMTADRLLPKARRLKLMDEKLRDRGAFKPSSKPKSSPVQGIVNKGIYKATLGRRR